MAKKKTSNKKTRKTTWKQKLISVLRFIFLSNFTRGVLVGIVMLFFTVFAIGMNYQRKHSNDGTQLGMSFSAKYARDLGIDEQAALQRLIDTGFTRFRLMSYWDLVEPVEDVYDFGWLDSQIEAISEADGEVILALGMRQPRYPECHIPAWANPDQPDKNQLLEFIEVVVERYKGNPTIKSWQLENESANRLFGECPDFDRGLFNREFDLVSDLDPDRELLTNASNTVGWPLRGPVGDRVGFSNYSHFHYRGVASTYWWVPNWWHAFRAQMVEWRHGKSAYIHELQTEPWGPGWIGDLSLDEQDIYYSADRLDQTVKDAEATGMRDIYLWGGEFWVWRAEQGNDDYLEAIETIFDRQR